MDEPMKAGTVPEDDDLQSMMRDRMIGASQQATFHRIEAEKFERIARAAAASIVQLEDGRPVATLDADEVYSRAVKEREGAKPDVNHSMSGQSAGPSLAH